LKYTRLYGLINLRILIQPSLAIERAALPESSASNFGQRAATLAQFYWFSSLRTAKFGTGHNRTLLHYSWIIAPSDTVQSELPTP